MGWLARVDRDVLCGLRPLLSTGRPVGTPFTGHTRGVLAVATAQLDGRPVVISGSNDKTVRVWDLAARTHS